MTTPIRRSVRALVLVTGTVLGVFWTVSAAPAQGWLTDPHLPDDQFYAVFEIVEVEAAASDPT